MFQLSKTLIQHRSLIFELTKREFTGRYRGSFGGIAWSFIQPLFLLSIYTLAFGVILKTRWGTSGDTTEYALMLFAGLIVFNAFSECLIKSSTLISSNPNFVKKVVFPLELLPVVTVAAVLVHALIAIAVWYAGYIIIFGIPHLSSLFFPIILTCLIPILLGIALLFSAIGVVVRDINQVTGMLNHALLFLTPIFYSIEAAPPILRTALIMNPLTFIVEQLRAILFLGHMPNFTGLFIYFLVATLFAWCSLLLFRRLRPTFADMV